MTPATIIREAQVDGVRLALSPAGNIKATGDGAAVNRWLAVIREHKAEIMDVLNGGAADTATASRGRPIHYPDRDPAKVACCSEVTHAENLEGHPGAVAAEPFTPTVRQASELLTAEEEAAIRAWLALIEETDPATVAEVISQCQWDADARRYFVWRAAAEPPKPDCFPDDRRTCDQCANPIAQRCQAAKRGEIVASRNYEPIRNLPRRCESYAPGAADVDRRPGWDRWPRMTDLKGTK